MKTVKFLMIAFIAAFTVNFANAQTSPAAKAPVKTVAPAAKVVEKKAEKKAEKVEAKVDTAAKKAKHKAHKKA